MPPFDIDPEAIRKLADLMTETGLSEIELAEGDRRVRVSRAVAASASPAVHFAAPATAAPAAAEAAAASPATHPGAVISPMVGTAYLQAEPDAPPFVTVGSQVKVGDTLLIIEAMKVMNPIKASKGGTLTQVLVSDGQPVEYGEPLMIVE
ncbi:MAG TPA: acetyl-CoA carboxylase biotin carboxyl carrier protein [Alphaproteobacteria bacterium]|jgi:acetyl-CoA carboxylase biotin carboxyl carrier protein|nr:acetyl-CoA carboxylase biotin carboxyl carrier protein [Alphaproteobacteria bacterium]